MPKDISENLATPVRFRSTECVFGATPLHAVGMAPDLPLKLTRWRVAPYDDQPTLRDDDFHVIDFHRAGVAYRTDRQGAAVRPRTFSVEPAGSTAVWRGDVENEYSHFYLSAAALRQLAEEITQAPVDDLRLDAVEGAWDTGFTAILETCEQAVLAGGACRFDLDSWFRVLGTRVIKSWSSYGPSAIPAERLQAPLPVIRRALDCIEAGLGEDLSVADVARASGASVTSLNAAFKAAFGKTVYQYVLARRIERAKDLIRRTDDPLACIAIAAGFASQSHMTEVFRQKLGVTPRGFRKG